MRILMLSWEFPPVLVGGLGRHVHALAGALAHAGHDVTVVTRYGEHSDGSPAALDETVEYANPAGAVSKVRVVRAPDDPPAFPFAHDTLMQWAMGLNHSLTRAALHAAKTQDFDVVHAHDWLVTHAAVTLKHHLGVPLTATLHSTEAGRHRGWLPNEVSKSIHAIEWWLTYEARRVLVCSEYMRWEVNQLFDLPSDKAVVVPNGVDVEAFTVEPARARTARDRFAPQGPLLVYAGRLVHEKGVQDLLDAVPVLAERHPGLRVVVAGEGAYEPELRDQAARRHVADKVTFSGFMSGDRLPELMAAADCFVMPSRYEPFGMVALEAAAAGTPVVAAECDGLAEFIVDGDTGSTHTPGDPEALADAVSRVLDDSALAQRLRDRAAAMVRERFTWASIAEQVAQVHRQAEEGERAVEAQLAAEELRIVIPDGKNLLGI
ncbi:MAG: glycosyltransferase family 4 protein [Stackebrandtia sp.]